MTAPAGHVFGYGSLLALAGGAVAGTPCRLRGFRRAWNVAMDNAVDLPGYKYYVDATTRERPAVMVTFVNIEPDRAGHVNGFVFAVSTAVIDELDDRERNYRRREVGRFVSVSVDGPVWAYGGTDAARRRYDDGFAAGGAVISRAYHDGLLAGFDGLGSGELDEFRRTTLAPAVPLVDLLTVPVDDGRGQPGGPPNAV